MKSNRWNLVTAVLNMIASLLFITAAVFSDVPLAKGLFFVAWLCLWISSIGFFCTYTKNKKSEEDKSNET